MKEKSLGIESGGHFFGGSKEGVTNRRPNYLRETCKGKTEMLSGKILRCRRKQKKDEEEIGMNASMHYIGKGQRKVRKGALRRMYHSR